MAATIIVVPCYNEAERLDVEAFVRAASELEDLKFLMVNDGSTDATAAVLEKLETSVPGSFESLTLPANRGKAEAVRQGLMRAIAQGADQVAFWDADLSTPLEEIPRFLEALAATPQRLAVFGSRIARLGSSIERSNLRHYAGRLFATSASLVLGMGVYDTQCGAKLFRCDPRMGEAFSAPFISRWVFDVEILARLSRIYGAEVEDRILELPLARWRDVAGSKLGWRQGVRGFTDLVAIRRAYGPPVRR